MAGKNKKLGMKAKIFLGQSVLDIILFLLAAVMVVPFIYVIMVSFTDGTVYEAGKLILWPEKWSLEAYELVLSGSGFGNALKATLFITLIGTPMNVLFNAGLAYMLSKKNLPGRTIINKLVMFTMLFGAGMIPNYINMSDLGLLNTWWASILPGACGAYTVMVMRSFFEGLPAELEEAAKIDGCSTIRIFGIIVLPLSKAMLATFTLFAAVSYWNTYFSAVMYLTRTDMYPLQVYLQKIVLSANISDVIDMSSDLINTVPTEIMKMATVVVAVVPILCVYPFLQKHFAKGVMVGAVKG
ncbi:MAG: carbohydrate ABC transporter permease [Lachnospiraceae bacterium]|nr:carbohydrate ABC transporter permease [Lachnospiraceae bacterium]